MSDEHVDYYQVLGVSEDATPEQIETIYSKLMRIYHPDINSDKTANAQAIRINAAFEVLGNPIKRREYDQNRHEAQEQEECRESTAPPAYYYERQPRGKHSGFIWFILKTFVFLLLALLIPLAFVLELASCSAKLVLGLVSIIALILSAVSFFFMKNITSGVVCAVVALLTSPFGIPLVADWLVAKLNRLNNSLRCFIKN